MSWSGFKKNVGRATTQVMMKTGHVEKTADREYEVEERRYRTLESASLRLQKEAKGYLDSLRAMTASQMRIAETIDAFYGDSGARDGVSRSYKQAVEDLDAETIKALDGPYRCVPTDLRKHVWQDGGAYMGEEITRIEWQMNAGRVQTKVAEQHAQYREFEELMDYVYRQTVLEPINRFCTYFTDINECIKKRNHKMLDYDALRSKVRKLTEKPDKDASKLPRTEKELEMVSVEDMLREGSTSSPTCTSPSRSMPPGTPRRTSLPHYPSYAATVPDIDQELLAQLKMPSPPKVLNRFGRRQSDQQYLLAPLLKEDHPALSPSSSALALPQMDLSDNLASVFESLDRDLSPLPNEMLRSRKPVQTLTDLVSSTLPASIHASPLESTDDKPSPTRQHDSTLMRSSTLYSLSSIKSDRSSHRRSGSTHESVPSIKSPHRTMSHLGRRAVTASPFFSPKDLDDIMRPVKENFIRKEADTFLQAKAAYDQLNDQLTSELPQLIDLRVPYLDPSFEALVKIQLRFCAEAYSRMAQVQQYLDASTRDSYASGELDARVEDVLGQIRELSIAGTV